MGCGCNKRAQRRSQVIRTNTRPRNNTEIRLNSNSVNNSNRNVLGMQSVGNRDNKLNQGGVSAEKRRIQAIRRNEILKKLGKR